MLSDRCLSCLSATLVYCGETVGRIKMKLGTQVGLGPGHIVLDGYPAPPIKPYSWIYGDLGLHLRGGREGERGQEW